MADGKPTIPMRAGQDCFPSALPFAFVHEEIAAGRPGAPTHPVQELSPFSEQVHRVINGQLFLRCSTIPLGISRPCDVMMDLSCDGRMAKGAYSAWRSTPDSQSSQNMLVTAVFTQLYLIPMRLGPPGCVKGFHRSSLDKPPSWWYK